MHHELPSRRKAEIEMVASSTLRVRRSLRKFGCRPVGCSEKHELFRALFGAATAKGTRAHRPNTA
jgi:hypothetical protein